MRRIHHERVERKLRSVNQCIREAEERKGRGDPGAVAELSSLRNERAGQNHEMRQATSKDYILDRNRKREIRTKFQKIIDTLHCER